MRLEIPPLHAGRKWEHRRVDLAASAGILATGALPRFVGYAGFVAAALQLAAAVALDGVALGAFAAWAALAGFAMLKPRGG